MASQPCNCHFLIVGAGGRESAFALKLAAESCLSAFVSHKNPTILQCVERSGGNFRVGDVRDPQAVTRFALENGVDYAFVSADEPLAHGVVDALLDAGIKTAGATRAAARIEWDKTYAMELMQQVAAEFTPQFTVIAAAEQIEDGLRKFAAQGLEVVVKPQGLTGGKGVKVMPEHLPDYAACAAYAHQLLATRPEEQVLLVEKLTGIEFTIMGLTDGQHLVMSPASYDYPFRFANDTGPGTGGMGCFTAADGRLPFLTDADLDACRTVMQRVIQRLGESGARFNGVLNGGFFKTATGIRFMEFNSRFGDPEGLNILAVLQTSFAELLRTICAGTLSADHVAFAPQASVIKYLVAPEYPASSPTRTAFTLDSKALAALGLVAYCGACESTGELNRFTTLGSSRVLAIGATDDDIAVAADRVNRGIDQCVTGKLEYRADIGSPADIARLVRLAAQWH